MDEICGLPGLSHTELSETLTPLYGGCCESEIKLSAGEPLDIAAELAAMVRDVWKKKGMPYNVNKAVTGAFANHLWEAVTEGFGKGLDGLDYDTPDYTMLANLRANVYHFSAAKNYQQLKALTTALIGDDGRLRSFADFKAAAFDINDTHVNQWLKTEYDTAVGSAQMASKWVEIIKNKSTLTILEMDVVLDKQTSDICRPLHGIRKKIEDPFWLTYYPPNHFRCRSTVRQRSGSYTTPDSKIEQVDIPAMFRTNLAQNGLVFPEKHPYYIDAPAEVLIYKEETDG